MHSAESASQAIPVVCLGSGLVSNLQLFCEQCQDVDVLLGSSKRQMYAAVFDELLHYFEELNDVSTNHYFLSNVE